MLARSTPMERPVTITATDKWTVVVKGNPGFLGELFKRTGESQYIKPPEVVAKYGDMRDWRNSVGTGAFMFVDYVPGSSATFVRNPNYWMKDPVGTGKGNQLPYLDGAKIFVIPDLSTQLAALRTGKIDQLRDVSWEQTEALLKTTPQLKTLRGFGSPNALYMRLDKPDQPWHDIRVRRAMNMAIDRQAIVKDYYRGNAEIIDWLIPYSEWMGVYISLEKMSPTARELYEYHPEKARQLLADAGYPNGFKMEVVLEQPSIDEASILKEHLSKIGVEINMAVKERTVFASISTGRTYKEAIYAGGPGRAPYGWQVFRPTDPANKSMIDDPIANKAIDDFAKYFMIDDATAYGKIMKEFYPYVYEQAWMVGFPMPHTYTLWWPWVKNYYGEWSVSSSSTWNFPIWIWVDQALKKSMGF